MAKQVAAKEFQETFEVEDRSSESEDNQEVDLDAAGDGDAATE